MSGLMFPTSQDIYIEINGRKLAVVEGYKAQSSQSSKYIEAFGESQPVGTISGRITHMLQLSRICVCVDVIEDNIDLYSLHNFNMVIVKPDRRIIYSGCEWVSIKESASLNDAVLENVEIIATKRMEVRS